MSVRALTSWGGLLLTAWLSSGCGEVPVMPVEPAPATLTGVWSGAVTESYGGAGRLRLVVEQVQFALTGSFAFEFADPTRNRAGMVTGSTGTSLFPQRMQLTALGAFDCGPGQQRDSFLLVSWERLGDTLKGTYQGFACVGTITGSFEVERER